MATEEGEEAYVQAIGASTPSHFVRLDRLEQEEEQDKRGKKEEPGAPPVITHATAATGTARDGAQGGQLRQSQDAGVRDMHADMDEDRRRLVEALDRSTILGSWSSRWFACLTQLMPSCCCACFCPCVLNGQMSEALGYTKCHWVAGGGFLACAIDILIGAVAFGGIRGNSLCCIYNVVWTCVNRRRMRTKFAIGEWLPCSDLLCSFFCTQCSVAQMARHLYGYRAVCEPPTCNRLGVSLAVTERLRLAQNTLLTFGPNNSIDANGPHGPRLPMSAPSVPSYVPYEGPAGTADGAGGGGGGSATANGMATVPVITEQPQSTLSTPILGADSPQIV